jgi:hypothetical protein
MLQCGSSNGVAARIASSFDQAPGGKSRPAAAVPLLQAEATSRIEYWESLRSEPAA